MKLLAKIKEMKGGGDDCFISEEFEEKHLFYVMPLCMFVRKSFKELEMIEQKINDYLIENNGIIETYRIAVCFGNNPCSRFIAGLYKPEFETSEGFFSISNESYIEDADYGNPIAYYTLTAPMKISV